ncbi:MAG: 5-(carboxyamino)imidazole ribonucleotide mutase [Candidatus Zixiibacteriota bacterium]|jgi:phosphoribosylaminoimidazole carboxylase PurE protein|nr:MAG: 5-(carboxyamino)imidazole ribonucleotide mutase [candidate division Zixibacteria bacterium]
MAKAKTTPLVAIVMGSDSDLPVMKQAADALDKFAVPCELKVISAHRTPAEAAAYAQSARKRGIRVIIAGAGMAAHLAGAMAAQTELPIIGVPLASGSLSGQDALLATVQMPKGVPVATVAIGGAFNAGLLAVQILGVGDAKLLDKFKTYKARMRKDVLAKKV